MLNQFQQRLLPPPKKEWISMCMINDIQPNIYHELSTISDEHQKQRVYTEIATSICEMVTGYFDCRENSHWISDIMMNKELSMVEGILDIGGLASTLNDMLSNEMEPDDDWNYFGEMYAVASILVNRIVEHYRVTSIELAAFIPEYQHLEITNCAIDRTHIHFRYEVAHHGTQASAFYGSVSPYQ